MTPAGKALKEAYQWEAKSQWKGKPLQGDVSLSITLYFGTKRKADLDNFNKLSLDALTGIAYEDDSQVAELHLKRGYDKARPRIELVLHELDQTRGLSQREAMTSTAKTTTTAIAA